MEESKVCMNINHKLIVTVIKKGMGTKIVGITKAAGAEGGTIFLGRGSTREDIYLDILGMNFEPEKEIVFTFVREEIADKVLEAINKDANLCKPGTGISFIINIKGIAGICHLMNQ